jgi:hypothetical protein
VTIIPFSQLEGADLVVDAVYEGSDSGNLADDPIAQLLKGGNAGNFRYCGSIADLRYLIVCTLKEDTDWQDILDLESGTFSCYGDRRTPGHDLHDTPKNQNVILRNIFNCLHHRPNSRMGIPRRTVRVRSSSGVSARPAPFILNGKRRLSQYGE